VLPKAPLAGYTRFAIGGAADVLVESADADCFAAALKVARASGLPVVVIGGGTNLVVADEGFGGVVLRLTAEHIAAEGTRVRAAAGAVLQKLVEFSIGRGLKGLETLAGIPGSVGGATYGNAGAYGHSISESVAAVRYLDEQCEARTLSREACGFRYRDSAFKRNRNWVVLEVELELAEGDREELAGCAGEILAVRNAKFPETMMCAGSIFKNLLASELPPTVTVPERVVREGKIPAAYFLEQVGAKGMTRGAITVADYHANLIYNRGGGTAAQLRALLAELKLRVRERFGLEMEEEVQYIGF
jgi:UDP-N-acetylmuramate dehydrogenase